MADDLSSILRSNEATLLVRGGDSEGPCWHPEGYLTFARFRMNQLIRWDPTTKEDSVIRENTGYGNGCTLDLQGRLIMCEGDARRVTRMERDGSITVVADNWQGKRFNKPNDVVCRSDGSIYFTDPVGESVPVDQRELGFAGVFRVTPAGELQIATDECEYPNGLAFSPDESVLYVAITRRDLDCIAEVRRGEVCPHRLLRAFDVAADGSLSNNRVFASMSTPEKGNPDGVAVDTDGRVYCTGAGGVWVFDPAGNVLGIIRLPEGPRNLAFGGPNLSTLYVTAGDALYSMETKVRGIGSKSRLS